MVAGPDNVRVEVVEPGFAGVKTNRAPAAPTTEKREPYTTPRTPWGEPDLQGIYTGINGRAPFQVSSAKMKLTERYTRIGPNALE